MKKHAKRTKQGRCEWDLTECQLLQKGSRGRGRTEPNLQRIGAVVYDNFEKPLCMFVCGVGGGRGGNGARQNGRTGVVEVCRQMERLSAKVSFWKHLVFLKWLFSSPLGQL